jgi:c-di-GMP-binding flagellar brake protein YcgR
MKRGEQEYIGWTLNLSRGGLRIVVEDPIELNTEYTVVFGQDEKNENEARPVRVAWIQDEAGGQIAGLQFLDVEGTIPPQDPPERDE